MRSETVKGVAVPEEIRPLVREIRARLSPESIWLFGSRVRGSHRPDSDWDLVVALKDDADPDLLDPLVGWSIQHELGIPATIVTTTVSALSDCWGAVNTIGYDLAHEGRRLDG